MGNSSGVEKGTPLSEVLENWRRIDGTKGLGKKKLVQLCQKDWPLLTNSGNPAERWPGVGTFDLQELTFLRQQLEDRFPKQMDYWYVWDNWAFARQKEKPRKVSLKALQNSVTAPSAPPCAPPPAVLSSPSSSLPPVAFQAPLTQVPVGLAP